MYKINQLKLVLLTITVISQCQSRIVNELTDETTQLLVPNVLDSLTHSNLVKATEMGVDFIQKQERLEKNIAQSRNRVQHGSISHGLLLENYPTRASTRENQIAHMILKSTKYLMNSHCIGLGVNSKTCAAFVSDLRLPSSTLLDLCKQQSLIDAGSMYRRLLPNNYKDGIHEFPVSVTGAGSLPDARHIAEKLFVASSTVNKRNIDTAEGRVDADRSIAVAQWAQFIEQDLARTMQTTMHDGTSIECCDRYHRKVAPRSFHPACHPLKISDSDSFYKKIDVSCLNYVRSAIAVNPECKFGPVEQINRATNKLDLSQLYGVTQEDTRKLRRFRNGKLHTREDNAALINLPLTTEADKFCSFNDNRTNCYQSGDPRVNSNPYSIALHTIFLRSHNKIATNLAKRNPAWTDEELFQKSRILNIILYQRIIYEEWAPVVLGKQVANEILSKTSIDDPNRVSNEFATVGIRFYNTMFPGDLVSSRNDEENSVDGTEPITMSEQLFKLEDVQYRPVDVKLDKIMSAIIQNHAMSVDTSYVDDLSNQLYRSAHTDNQPFGSDSLALDIQRSRDHGLPGYVKYVSACSKNHIETWNDLLSVMDLKELNLLKELYGSVEDIDLIVGALSEKPKDDATVGPTLQCIIAEQLVNTRLNDNKFYDKRVELSTTATTATHNFAAGLLCDTTTIQNVQNNIFLVPSQINPSLSCSEIDRFPKLRLKA